MLPGQFEHLGAAATTPTCCHRRHFPLLNVSTSRCIQVDILLEFCDHGVLQSTTEGLLRLVYNATEPVRLLNPLTHHVAELPSINTISVLDRSSPAYIGDVSHNNAGLVDGGNVSLLYLYEDEVLAFAKPEDELWLVVTTNCKLVASMSFASQFCGVCATTQAVMMDTARADMPPRLVVAADLSRRFYRWAGEMVHLVDNGGELVLVHRLPNSINTQGRWRKTYMVDRVKLVAGKTTPVAAAHGRAIFIGYFRGLSVPPHVFASLSANTVYPTLRFSERYGDKGIGAYHLKDGSTEYFNYDSLRGLASPWAIVDSLAA